jgi:hypothetical protein
MLRVRRLREDNLNVLVALVNVVKVTLQSHQACRVRELTSRH